MIFDELEKTKPRIRDVPPAHDSSMPPPTSPAGKGEKWRRAINKVVNANRLGGKFNDKCSTVLEIAAHALKGAFRAKIHRSGTRDFASVILSRVLFPFSYEF